MTFDHPGNSTLFLYLQFGLGISAYIKIYKCVLLLLLLSLYLKLTNIQKEKKKTPKKIDVNLEHHEHLATMQNKKKSIVLIKVN